MFITPDCVKIPQPYSHDSIGMFFTAVTSRTRSVREIRRNTNLGCNEGRQFTVCKCGIFVQNLADNATEQQVIHTAAATASDWSALSSNEVDLLRYST